MVRENGLLADALLEHNPDDPNFGPPYRWPCWTDDITVGVGPPLDPGEVIPDPPAPQPDPGALPGEDAPLVLPPDDDEGDPSHQLGDEPFEPSEEDLADYREWCLDLIERAEYERGCAARFV